MSKVAILTSVVMTLLVGGGKIEWSKFTLEEGLAESKRSGKPVFAYFTSGCTFSKQQDEGAFSNDEVVARTRQFICVKVNCAERKVLAQYKKQYKFLGTPTVLVLDGEGRGLATFDGLTTAAEFIKKLDEVLLAMGPQGGVAPSSGLPQDARAKEILARIEKELAESHQRLQNDVEQIVRSELEKAWVAKTIQPPPVEPPKEGPKEAPWEERKPAYFGIQPETLTDGERAELDIEPPYGFRLYEVKKGSPAEAAGLKPGDILLAIGGMSVSEETMGDRMAAYRAGDTVEVTILRDGKKMTLKVTFTERK